MPSSLFIAVVHTAETVELIDERLVTIGANPCGLASVTENRA